MLLVSATGLAHPIFASIPVQHSSKSSKFVYLNPACGKENRKCHRYARCVVKSGVEYCNCNIGFQGDGYSCLGELIVRALGAKRLIMYREYSAYYKLNFDIDMFSSPDLTTFAL